MGTKSVAQTVTVDRGEIMSRKTFLLRKHHRGRFCFFGGKHRAQTKSIKLFIFSCFAVETLCVSREEISFNIRFSHSPLLSAVRRSLLFPFFSEKTWIVSDYESYHMVKAAAVFSLILLVLRDCFPNNKVGCYVYANSRIPTVSHCRALSWGWYSVSWPPRDSLFAPKCSSKRVRVETWSADNPRPKPSHIYIYAATLSTTRSSYVLIIVSIIRSEFRAWNRKL